MTKKHDNHPAEEAAMPNDMQVENSSTEQSQTELEVLKAELADAKDKLLRARAETENIRKRGILDVEAAHKYSVEKIARELVQVVDSLEKGLEAAEGSDAQHIAAMKEGMELTHKLLMSTLEKFYIKQIDPSGQPFDPKLHEALTTQPTTEVDPNKILTVVQKGFVIHDRVLRPARVIVAKAPENPGEAS